MQVLSVVLKTVINRQNLIGTKFNYRRSLDKPICVLDDSIKSET